MEKKEERRASEMAQRVATKWSVARWSRAPSLTIEKCASIHSHDKSYYYFYFKEKGEISYCSCLAPQTQCGNGITERHTKSGVAWGNGAVLARLEDKALYTAQTRN